MPKYYSRAQVCADLGIHWHTLYRYEQKGLIPEPKRNPMNGYRRYTDADVEQIRRLLQPTVTGSPKP